MPDDDLDLDDETLDASLDDEPIDASLDDDVLDDDLETDLETADLDLDVVAAVIGAPVPETPGPDEDEEGEGEAEGDGEEDVEDEDVLDLEEELHPDDIEVPLDTLLQERVAAATLEDDEDELEDELEVDDRVEGPTKVVPRRPGEFLCSSCFLVLPRHQLADEERMLCRDCA